jgi:hypothetical protein
MDKGIKDSVGTANCTLSLENSDTPSFVITKKEGPLDTFWVVILTESVAAAL